MTPAIRLNDTTDIWSARGGRYKETASRHHRTARDRQAREVTDLGLYSITFSNEVAIDAANAEAYTDFRSEAAEHEMRHFLEVFNPAFDIRLKDEPDIGAFINDNIVRTLAGVMEADHPLFLKLQYNGPRAMEELSAYDPGQLIVGILGGAKGTTRDTFELIAQAERHGARVALFGRKINLAEEPLEIVRYMRAVVEGEMKPEEAVKAYHAGLKTRKIKPTLPTRRGSPDHRGGAEGLSCRDGAAGNCLRRLLVRRPQQADRALARAGRRIAVILTEEEQGGGNGANASVDLKRLAAPFPVEAIALVGDDEDGRFLLGLCDKLGIEPAAARTSPDAAAPPIPT